MMMSEALKRVQGDVITAMKAKDRTRVDILRQFVNKVQMVAKNDPKGPRDVTDEDVITAGLKTVKEANETLTMKVPNTDTIAMAMDDPRRETLNTEIAIVSEYLPRKMDEAELRALITRLSANAPEGKSAKGYYMKELNGSHKGEFDNQMAQSIIGELVG
jgi:uncharacterized protein YqeY